MICLMIDNQCRLLDHPYVYTTYNVDYYYSSYVYVKVKFGCIRRRILQLIVHVNLNEIDQRGGSKIIKIIKREILRQI